MGVSSDFIIENGVLKRYNGSDENVVIPDGVVEIGNQAFMNCKCVKRVTIPDSVVAIGEEAFADCTSLASITVPKSVVSIGAGAFRGCSKVESITVEAGNEKYHGAGNCLIETQSKTLIRGCTNSVVPADGSVIVIGNGAFEGCWNIGDIAIPDGITSIGDFAFHCSSVSEITIPGSVVSIGKFAFARTTLRRVRILEGVTTIGEGAFYFCNYFEMVKIPQSVTFIDKDAFALCGALERAFVPKTTKLAKDAFGSNVYLDFI